MRRVWGAEGTGELGVGGEPATLAGIQSYCIGKPNPLTSIQPGGSTGRDQAQTGGLWRRVSRPPALASQEVPASTVADLRVSVAMWACPRPCC